jgi:hypothetical protein
VQANLLWAALGDRCAFPGCNEQSITIDGDRHVNIGEIAYIQHGRQEALGIA